jgi:hypothetical protein
MRRAAFVVVAVLLVACARRTPVLTVESAAVDFPDGGGAGRLTVTARYAHLAIDPERPVRLDVGQSARWVRLERVQDAGRVWAVDGAEHGYALRVDLDADRVTATEPDAVPPDANPLLVGFAQGRRAACTRLRFVATPGRWTFDGTRDAQCQCRADAQGKASACTPPTGPEIP